MEDSETECLPDNFVGVSKPSKIIEKLYRKKEIAEKNALEHMEIVKREICEKYEKIITEKSTEVIRRLDDIKGSIKNEVNDTRMEAKYNRNHKIEKQYFNQIYGNIENYTEKRINLVEEFHNELIGIEKAKSDEFKDILKKTYEEIKKISFKLPREYDERIEFEIEKFNQSILSNHRNYLELKKHLELEIENDGKLFIEELRHIKECWIKFLREQTEKAVMTLKSQNLKSLVMSYAVLEEKENNNKKEFLENLNQVANVSSFIEIQRSEEWLRRLRQKLARVDNNAQKILANFKQAAVLVFNRFFQELRVIADQLHDMVNKEEDESTQCEMYTPTLEEIKHQYDVELEIIQKTWDDLVDQLVKTVDNTYKFLLAGATLWENHFKRTEMLQVLILKDVDNTVKANDNSSEPYESKLNVLIDNLRQEPSKEKLNKTLEDIKKLLIAMEELYKAQFQSEVAVYKKYKALQDLKTDILLTEIKRFLRIYPPDLEKDPKIQRKRASQTSEIADPSEALIPNQMMYCKYQIDAVSNWQFGLWEAVTNYVTVARAEIQAETDKWIKSSVEKLEKRLSVRLAIHALRMEKIMGYIYEIRLEELCIHETRFDEHRIAVEKQMNELKEEYNLYLEKCENSFQNYDLRMKHLETKSTDLPNSGAVNSYKTILKAYSQNCIEQVNQLLSEYLQKFDRFYEKVKAVHIRFSKNIKLFSEGGNFAIQEIKDYLKHQGKIESQVEKGLAAIRKDVETAKGRIYSKVDLRNSEATHMIQMINEEHEFRETVANKLKNLNSEVMKIQCEFQKDFETNVSRHFEESKLDYILNCGDFDYFNKFSGNIKDLVIISVNMANYLYHPAPVILYSDKTLVNNQTQRNEEQALTSTLFNFSVNEEGDNYLSNLNKTLLSYWNDIVGRAKDRIAGFQNLIKHPRIKTEDVVPEFTGSLQDIMKPVDPAVKRLIYTGNNKDGRINYFHERIKLLPEDRRKAYSREWMVGGWNWWIVFRPFKRFGRPLRPPVLKNGSIYIGTLDSNLPDLYKTDIISNYQVFYFGIQRNLFYLDESKVPHNFVSFLRNTLDHFLIIQNQSETRWIQETMDFLNFLDNFITFVEDYTGIYLEEYTRKGLKKFEKVFHTDMQELLEKSKNEVKEMFLALQKKLKPLHGHPSNRSLLEKLEVEANIIEIRAKELLEEVYTPLMDKLQNNFEKTMEEFSALKNLIPDLIRNVANLKPFKDDLNIQLLEKIQLLRTFIEICQTNVNKNSSKDNVILKNCESFLDFYEKNELPADSYDVNLFIKRNSLLCKFESFNKTISAKSISLNKTAGESVTILDIEEVDSFLEDLKNALDKCSEELENENFDRFIKGLKNEWSYAVNTVLDLYKLKYDQ